eukprot:6208806-Pleurochrysis_carterae.AAC.1
MRASDGENHCVLDSRTKVNKGCLRNMGHSPEIAFDGLFLLEAAKIAGSMIILEAGLGGHGAPCEAGGGAWPKLHATDELAARAAGRLAIRMDYLLG